MKLKKILVICYTVIVSAVLCWTYRPSHFSLLTRREASPPRAYISDEKFMTYLPHSGLHNQRIALINALVIARELNRTLIMPDLNLGNGAGWKPFHVLQNNLHVCSRALARQRMSSRCIGYRDYFPTSFDTIFNMSVVKQQGIRTIQRRDMRSDYFLEKWGAVDDDNDFFILEDSTRYSYRIYDDPKASTSLDKYLYRLDLDRLRTRQEPFLIFGSLFGSSRLVLSTPELVKLHRLFEQTISISHTKVLKGSRSIIKRLGGKGEFTSVHVRYGSSFASQAQSTINKIKSALLHGVKENRSSSVLVRRLRSIPTTTKRMEACRKVQKDAATHPRLQMIYLATDNLEPRVAFSELYEHFACIFSIYDFQKELKTADDSVFGSLLIPLVEAEIASQARQFVGTGHSTYSRYIKRRNEWLMGSPRKSLQV